MVVRFGIMGCANIARKNARAIFLSGNCTLVAVASRSLEKAESFIDEIDHRTDKHVTRPRAYGSYEELLQDPNVDAIYLPLPTTQHLEWVRAIAHAKKHILIEKPVAVSLEDLDLMFAVCIENQVVLMDGLMFQHHDRLIRLINEMQDPFCGPAVSVNSSFSFRGDADFLSSNIRTSESADPLGALGDLGWYNIRLSLLAMNARSIGPDLVPLGNLSAPSKITGVCTRWAGENNRVPIECRCLLEWEGTNISSPRRVASFDCSFTTAFRQRFEIICHGQRDKGCSDKIFTCDDFVIPASPRSASFQVESIHAGFPGIDNACRIHTQRETITVDTRGGPGYGNGSSSAAAEKKSKTCCQLRVSVTPRAEVVEQLVRHDQNLSSHPAFARILREITYLQKKSREVISLHGQRVRKIYEMEEEVKRLKALPLFQKAFEMEKSLKRTLNVLNRTEKDHVSCNAKRPEVVGVAKTFIKIDGRDGDKVYGWGRDAVSSIELLKARADVHRLVSKIENLQDSINYEKKGRKQRIQSSLHALECELILLYDSVVWKTFVDALIWSLRSVRQR